MRGATALHMAVELNDIDLVQFILEQPEVEIERQTWDHKTALDIAVGRNLSEVETLLRRHSAQTPLGDDIENESDDSGNEQVTVFIIRTGRRFSM